MTRLILFLIFFGIAQSSQTAWVVVSDWSSGQPFDATQWTFERGFIRNWEDQYYTGGAPSNFLITRGGIRLVGLGQRIANAAYRNGSSDWRQARVEARYTSASLVTIKAWQNVKVEVVAQVRVGKGAWPAIWLRGPNQHGFGEIDLMEHLGREPETVYTTVHYGASPTNLHVNTAMRAIPEFQGNDITYSAELTPEKLTVDVNNQLMLAMDRRVLVGKTQPLQQPYNLVLNLALGGSWSGKIDDASLPAVMTIKSIRIWEWRPDGNRPRLANELKY